MENSKKLQKRNIVLYVSIAVFLVCATFKTSYAYFTATVVNKTTPTPSVITTDDLQLSFAPGATYISAQNMSLTTAEDALLDTNNYSAFTIRNTGTANAKYKLYLSNYSITTNLVNADFKWRLKIGEDIYTGNFYELFNGFSADEHNVISSSNVDVPLLSTTISIPANQNHDCEFRIWLQEENRNQIELTEGTFRATIKLIATN